MLQSIRRLFVAAAEKMGISPVFVDITLAVRKEFGHFQCTSPLKLAKVLGKAPIVIATEWMNIVMELSPSLFAKMEVKPPGFINMWLRSRELDRRLEEMKASDRLAVPLEEPIRVICEFSSPNIAKLMHVGHLRSTIIGDSIARILEFQGRDVLRLNHLGDWGTQFGMLIAYIKERGEKVRSAGAEKLMQWYRSAKELFDADPDFRERARREVVELQGRTKESILVWEELCGISRREFDHIYSLLGVRLHTRGESFYNPLLEEVVGDFEKAGLLTVSDGAKCVFMEAFKGKEGEPLPLIIQKSDGGFNYATTDLAAFKYRVQSDKAAWIIILTDLGQSLHFQMVYEAVKRVGYVDDHVRFDHVGFGVVLSESGKKFKTRSGDTVHLIDLLDEAVAEAKKLLDARGVEEAEEKSIIIGIGAVKYADLCTTRTKDYTFSFERMLRFEGNTVVFILYAYVRIQSIFRKSGDKAFPAIKIEHSSEVDLALLLVHFGDVLSEITIEWHVHKLCEYLYDLATAFHAFFRDCIVIGSPEEGSRLALCHLTARVIRQGLDLLGIDVVDQL